MQAASNRLTSKIYEKYFTCFQGFYYGTCTTGGFEERNQASYERKAGGQLPAGMSIGGDENACTVESPN